MVYKIFYHHKIEEDISRLDLSTKKRIIETIEKRLSAEPQKYGKPLRKPLKSYWKLRIGRYRVVYKILEDEIWILAITRRDIVYKNVLGREQ